ncbi:Ribonuclease/ribotoxin [Armillaria nabsnona]|nr:Ribonuclease/ribotoxin [Armillaria nabsnona]
MKFVVEFTVLAAFFTFVFATPTKGRPAAPSVPPTKTECSTQKTCDECIAVKGASGSLVCGYSPTNDACVELSSASSASPSSLKLAHTTEDCKQISSQPQSESQQSSQHTPDAPKTTDAAQNTETQEGGNEKPAGDTTVAAQHKLLPDTVTCGTNTYSRTDIQAAIVNGHALINKPIGKGHKKSKKYPHEFKNHEGLTMGPGCAKTPYYEFPILSTHSLYCQASTDRVVFDPNGDYCALITHTGAAPGGFVSCT